MSILIWFASSGVELWAGLVSRPLAVSLRPVPRGIAAGLLIGPVDDGAAPPGAPAQPAPATPTAAAGTAVISARVAVVEDIGFMGFLQRCQRVSRTLVAVRWSMAS
ncbi:hypothetical protein [Georgenia muralis]